MFTGDCSAAEWDLHPTRSRSSSNNDKGEAGNRQIHGRQPHSSPSFNLAAVAVKAQHMAATILRAGANALQSSSSSTGLPLPIHHHSADPGDQLESSVFARTLRSLSSPPVPGTFPEEEYVAPVSVATPSKSSMEAASSGSPGSPRSWEADRLQQADQVDSGRECLAVVSSSEQ